MSKEVQIKNTIVVNRWGSDKYHEWDFVSIKDKRIALGSVSEDGYAPQSNHVWIMPEELAEITESVAEFFSLYVKHQCG